MGTRPASPLVTSQNPTVIRLGVGSDQEFSLEVSLATETRAAYLGSAVSHGGRWCCIAAVAHKTGTHGDCVPRPTAGLQHQSEGVFRVQDSRRTTLKIKFYFLQCHEGPIQCLFKIL